MPLRCPAIAGVGSCQSLWRWSTVTHSPATSLQKSPACRPCTPAPGSPGCLWALRRPLPQSPETSGGHPRSSPQPRVTSEETRAPTHQPQAQAPPCSSPHTGSPCRLAPCPGTADTAPMGVALMATLHLLGHSGKGVLAPRVSRAGMDAALMGCLWLTGPSKLAVQGLTMAIPQGAGQGPEQRLPQPLRPGRMSPVGVGTPSLAVAMTTWPQQLAHMGKAV